MKKTIILYLLFILIKSALPQENLSYQKPPKEILELVDVELAPYTIFDDKAEVMLFLTRNAYKTIEELSIEELRLGGLRINPKTNIGSRVTYYNNIRIKKIKEKGDVQGINGLPNNPRLSNFIWSPDQKYMAMTNTTQHGVELWLLNIQEATVKKLTDGILNANLGDVINWFSDSKSMLVKTISNSRQELINTELAIPTGPTISSNDGKKAQNRTYQDLLKNKNDEHNFEQLALSDIFKIGIDGSKTEWMSNGMFNSISFSPDGNYVMIKTVEKPFSYLVPYYRFASKIAIYDKNAKLVNMVADNPLVEDLPKGFMATIKGKRKFRWRTDKPASLIYAVALDEGDPELEVPFRDEVFQLDAPFKGDGSSLVKTVNRYSYIQWGNDEMAIAYDYWWNTRNAKTYLFNPSDAKQKSKAIFDRNYQDKYSDPGDFLTVRNEYKRNVLKIDKNSTYLIGDGHTAEGQFPFVDKLNMTSLKSERIYQSGYTDRFEGIKDYKSGENKLIVRIESPAEYPNYYFRSLKNNELQQLTAFENPFESISNVHKEVIKYKRDDGVDLSGTLYLPANYDEKEKLPMILWAYPVEYKDKSSAGQNTLNSNRFTYPYYGSPIYWVTRGYAVLNRAAFPIVGEGEEEPNDSFRKQLVANAKAAIDAVDSMGYIDRNRVAVGGHSYGAFMVANLLSHSDLFAAGVARSGAYNRTLTPFGFQSEERTYWDAPDVYYTMSPFMHADKMKYPLLLIHGEADNNSGTYPLQSERYFNALKGLGATVRLVMLPKESHGYRAKESIMHMLWEQDQWFEKYVKNK
ncbi:MAG: prolyl oligopeptidase family serine peptidase [Bacteroidales bacterium]|nr:prolyl oligopeptidase family serine peptidase [Bacteroidales bacterium]